MSEESQFITFEEKFGFPEPEIDYKVVHAAEPWINSDKIVPLIFAIADILTPDRVTEGLAESGHADLVAQVLEGTASRLREVRDLGWDHWPDDEVGDESVDLLQELGQHLTEEEARLEWVTDERLRTVVAASDAIIAKYGA